MSAATERSAPADSIAKAWWRSLQRVDREGNPNRTADPGALARLRRCATPLEALAEAQAMRLCREMGCRSLDDPRVEGIAALAIVLAHVREDARQDVRQDAEETRRGVTLGAMLGGKEPVMSDLRLRRLAAARDGVELLRGFREAVALLKGTAPVRDLARLMPGWLHPEHGERIRTRFLFDYHGASDAAPHDAGPGDPDAQDPDPQDPDAQDPDASNAA